MPRRSRPDPRRLAQAMSRRGFLVSTAASGLLVACGSDGGGSPRGRGRASSPSTLADARDAPPLDGAPFTLGVASGDPTARGVVLWTRLAPAPTAGGGMPAQPVPVAFEVARDPGMDLVVARGTVEARPEWAHAVHVDLEGLAPRSWYWYRFRTGPHLSAIGRTRTAPLPGRGDDRLRFALASCQKYTNGFYTSYPHMAAEDLDLVFFVGDYIYETTLSGPVRDHDGPEPMTLDAYRNRLALYKTDPDLQAAHAACPWVVTWDDHEVENDYSGGRSQDGITGEPWLARRAAAYRAYYEHQPLSVPPPEGPDLPIFRGLEWGELASFFVLDTRQYRTPQACAEGDNLICPGRFSPDATMLGDAQEGWLLDGMGRSPARWKLIAQQVLMGSLDLGGLLVQPDVWDGYVQPRQRILDFVSAQAIRNFVVLSGDAHVAFVNDLAAVAGRPDSGVIGSELLCTSISSGDALPEIVALAERIAVEAVPLVRYLNLRERGYTSVTLTPERLVAEKRFVATVEEPTSPIATGAVFEIRDGLPGARRIG